MLVSGVALSSAPDLEPRSQTADWLVWQERPLELALLRHLQRATCQATVCPEVWLAFSSAAPAEP
jgi:hypothetical protein